MHVSTVSFVSVTRSLFDLLVIRALCLSVAGLLICSKRLFTLGTGTHNLKTANEYGQEIPQPHTADQPMAPRGRAPEHQQGEDIRETKYN